MDERAFAIVLKPGGRVARLARTRSPVDETQEHGLWAVLQATVDLGFTRAPYACKRGRSGMAAMNIYMIALPQGRTDRPARA